MEDWLKNGDNKQIRYYNLFLTFLSFFDQKFNYSTTFINLKCQQYLYLPQKPK